MGTIPTRGCAFPGPSAPSLPLPSRERPRIRVIRGAPSDGVPPHEHPRAGPGRRRGHPGRGRSRACSRPAPGGADGRRAAPGARVSAGRRRSRPVRSRAAGAAGGRGARALPRRARGLPCTRGRPEAVSPRVAAEVGADALLLAPTRRGRVAGVLLGTTAEHLLRHASLPVLVLRGEPAFHRVLLTADLSPDSVPAHERSSPWRARWPLGRTPRCARCTWCRPRLRARRWTWRTTT